MTLHLPAWIALVGPNNADIVTRAGTARAMQDLCATKGLIVGGNAKKRRAGKSGPGHKPGYQARQSSSRLPPSINNSDFNKMFRQSCSECGSTEVVWTTVGAMMAMDDDPARRDRAREIAPHTGASAEAWYCNNCDGMGAFEQNLHVGGFGGSESEMFGGIFEGMNVIQDDEFDDASEVPPLPPRFKANPAAAAFSREAAARHIGLHCPDCGSTRFWWTDIATAIKIDPELAGEAHASAAELGDDADVWTCARCHKSGAIER